MARRDLPLRAIEIVRAAWGAALLIAPRQMLERVNHVHVDPASVVVARILGARQLTQSILSGVSPSPEILAMGVWVDAAHALSALGLAGVDRTRARAGLTDGAVAAVWAVLGYRDLVNDLVNDKATAGEHDRIRDGLARWALAWLPGGKGLRRRAESVRQRS